MKTNRMTIDAKRPSVRFPLRTIEVGRASALNLAIEGLPDDVQGVQFHVGRMGRSDFYPIPCTLVPGNRWSVYVSGLHLQDVGTTEYHISAKDERGNDIWIGKGSLEVVQSVLSVPEGEVPLIPEDTYVRNPATGLWHKLTCQFEDGMILPMIEEEGVTK